VPFIHRHDLERHFARHGEEFGALTALAYERLADNFMIKSLSGRIRECYRGNGDRVRFDPKTDTFGVMAASGYLATFMVVKSLAHSRQTATQYFESNCK
jgi:pyocin large subunit-like protein